MNTCLVWGNTLQDVIDDTRKIVVDRDRGLVLSERGALRYRWSTAANRSGVSGKSCCRYLRAKAAAGPPIVTMRSGLGPSRNVDRM